MPFSESPEEPVVLSVGPDEAGLRLDIFLAQSFPHASRVSLRKAINAGHVWVESGKSKAAYRLRAGDRVCVRIPASQPDLPPGENIPIEVIYEDEHLAVVNKPPGMVVHPGKGHFSGTLVAALQFRFRQLSAVGGVARPGIVHRLDRDTSGLLLVAKTDQAHLSLGEQFHERRIEKEYLAICVGDLDRDADVVDKPIGVHPYQRERMAIRRNHETSRQAETYYEVIERFRGFALLRVRPKTGRTHQIRVHLDSIGCPVLCDRQYSGRSTITRGEVRDEASDKSILLNRQALHARRLALSHPVNGEGISFEAPIPDDLAATLAELRAHRMPENPRRAR